MSGRDLCVEEKPRCAAQGRLSWMGAIAVSEAKTHRNWDEDVRRGEGYRGDIVEKGLNKQIVGKSDQPSTALQSS